MTPFVPAYIKRAQVFYDRKCGMMLLGEWRGDPWLFVHDASQDCWTSLRRATDDDVQTVAAAMRSAS